MAAKRYQFRSAQISDASKVSPFALRISQTVSGMVYFDKIDTQADQRQTFVHIKPKSALKLARWIIDNVEE